MLRQERHSGICSLVPLKGAWEKKSASRGPKTSQTIEEMPTVSYSCNIYLPERLCEPFAFFFFLLKAETYSPAGTLLFTYDAVVREIAQDAVGPCPP